jgi:hypothetical protein
MKTALLLLGVLTGLAPVLNAGEPPQAGGALAILDLEQGSFTGYARWRTPSVVAKDDKIVPLLEPARKGQPENERKPRAVVAADPPGKNWAALDFDDSRWGRVSGPLLVSSSGGASCGMAGVFGDSIYFAGNTVNWGQFFLRGKFRVDDPAQARDLRLFLKYYGGVEVYVNGRELCRGHLPQGSLASDTLAERYPEEAYVRPDGQVYREKDAKEVAGRMSVRVREVSPGGVPIPASMLRKGVNVIAISAHAAPMGEWLYACSSVIPDPLPWPHAGIQEARLSAAAGVAPNVGPSEGIALWTSQQMQTDEAWHYAHPADGPRPIRMVGARNGNFSGKVVLSSAAAIRNLRATVSAIVNADGKGRLPVALVQVRWAERATPAVRSGLHWSAACHTEFDRLLGEFPAEIPAVSLQPLNTKCRGAKAVVPVWVTVRVPPDAPAGDYRGTLTVEAQGTAPAAFTIPVELKVHDWRIPDPKDFTVHHNLYQSPDTLAQYYKVPLWSDKHWELLGKSLEVLGQAGNKICATCLVENSPAIDNSESMVRWIKKAEGSYDHDFSIFDKYLDLYAAKCGKPGILQINVWECWSEYKGKAAKGGHPFAVSVLDPATGKIVDHLVQPEYGTPENEAFWRPVFAELRQRLEKRGWFDVAAVVNAGYCVGPSKEVVTVYKNLWPDGKWMMATHASYDSYPGTVGSMSCTYHEDVWGSGGPLYDPDHDERKRTAYPRSWKQGARSIRCSNVRTGSGIVAALRDGSPLVLYRMISEAALQGHDCRGIGRVGGDYWPLPTGKEGQFRAMGGNYGGCSWSESTMSMTSPGPDGAIFNTRLESFREGVQLGEAVVFVQQALEAGKVSADFAKRAAALLDERARYYLRTRYPHPVAKLSLECSNWQERDSRLFALAAEVAPAAGAK